MEFPLLCLFHQNGACLVYLPAWGLSELASSCCGNSLHSLLPNFSGLYEQTFTPRSHYMSAAGHQKLCWMLWGSTGLDSAACVCTGAQSCPTLCDPMDCSPPGSSVHGIFQARILELVAISYSRGSSHPGIKPRYPALAGEFFTTEPLGSLIYLYLFGGGNGKPLQYSCLENSMDREAWWATVHGVAKSQTQLSA